MNTLLQRKSQTAFVCVWALSSCSEARPGPTISFFAYVIPYETCNQFFPFWRPQKCEDFHWVSYVCVRASSGTPSGERRCKGGGRPLRGEGRRGHDLGSRGGSGAGRLPLLLEGESTHWQTSRRASRRGSGWTPALKHTKEDSSRPTSLRRHFTRTPMTTSRSPLSFCLLPPPPLSPSPFSLADPWWLLLVQNRQSIVQRVVWSFRKERIRTGNEPRQFRRGRRRRDTGGSAVGYGVSWSYAASWSIWKWLVYDLRRWGEPSTAGDELLACPQSLNLFTDRVACSEGLCFIFCGLGRFACSLAIGVRAPHFLVITFA